MTGRKRAPRGILGVPKDAKRQMLFSFTAREGEEWESDSDDSDYLPQDDYDCEEGTVTSNHVKSGRTNSGPSKKRKPEQKRRKPVSGASASNGDTVALETTSCRELPPEVLLIIFQHVVNIAGSLPFLIRASRVCRLWRDVATHSSLWVKLDLSFGWIKSTDRTLATICPSRLSQTKDLSLHSWKNLTITGLKHVTDHCKLLESINLSHCSKLNKEAIVLLADHCPHLTCLDISSSVNSIPSKPLLHLIDKQGAKLTQLNLSGNMYGGFTTVLASIASVCRELTVLEIYNARFTNEYCTFDIEAMQRGCPKMRILRLGNSKFRAPQLPPAAMEASVGFPELEELSLAMNQTNAPSVSLYVNANFILRLLRTSERLQLLDLRQCIGILGLDMSSLAPVALSRLYLSRVSGQLLPEAISKWRGSLKELELSWMRESAMFGVVSALKSDPTSPLNSLSVLGSAVTMSDIQELLRCCPQLKSLNLQSCRDLPRGIKLEFSGHTLQTFRSEILAQCA